jgi:hypothetical protein
MPINGLAELEGFGGSGGVGVQSSVIGPPWIA